MIGASNQFPFGGTSSPDHGRRRPGHGEADREPAAAAQLRRVPAIVRLVLVGPPGAGKGPRPSSSRRTWRSRAISTGDIFRANVANGHRARASRPRSTWTPVTWSPTRSPSAMVRDRLAEADAKAGLPARRLPAERAAGRDARRRCSPSSDRARRSSSSWWSTRTRWSGGCPGGGPAAAASGSGTWSSTRRRCRRRLRRLRRRALPARRRQGGGIRHRLEVYDTRDRAAGRLLRRRGHARRHRRHRPGRRGHRARPRRARPRLRAVTSSSAAGPCGPRAVAWTGRSRHCARAGG